MTINFEDVLYLSGGPTSAVTKRTPAARAGDVFNVMDYGAVGTGTPTALSTRYGSLGAAQAVYPFVTSLSQECDYAAIQLALNTMWKSANKGGTLFLPPGIYLTNTPIDIGNHEIGSNYTVGRIVGSASTAIIGNISNDFIFYQDSGVNGPEEISYLVLNNTSTWIGSGALRLSNSSMVINRSGFVGMIGMLLPFDIYDVTLNSSGCGANSDATTGYNGTFGLAGYAPHIKGWRTTSPAMSQISLWGGNTSHIDGCGIENCVTAVLLGMFTGWASSCTVAPDGGNPGSSILTVGGNLGSGFTQFSIGQILYGRGLNLPLWGSDPNDSTGGTTITADHSTDGTLTGVGFDGTYRINGTYTITTPIPLVSRYQGSLSGCTVTCLQTEACFHSIYLNNVSACTIEAAGFGSNPIECPDQFGTTGLTPRAPLYIQSANATRITGCAIATASNYLGGVAFGANANIGGLTIDTCYVQKGADNVITASISGDVLTVTAFTSGSGIGVGMAISWSGGSDTILQNHVLDNSLTGSITTGTYRLASSHGTVTSRSMAVTTGAGWVLPTAAASKAGLRIRNAGGSVDGLSTGLNMTFTGLPGQAGSTGQTGLVEGMEYNIVDGAKSGGGTAAMGDATQGGGTQHIKVWWNGTDWIRNG